MHKSFFFELEKQIVLEGELGLWINHFLILRVTSTNF